MILLNKEQIKYLHGKMIQETGGSNGICDEAINIAEAPENAALSISRGFLRGG